MMTPDPLDPQDARLFQILRRRRFLARLVMTGEWLTACLWRPICWTIAYIGMALLNLPGFLGPKGAMLLLGLYLAGLAVLLIRDLRLFRAPSLPEIDRRIEQAGRLRHRPLAALDDSLANHKDSRTRTIWDISQARLKRAMQNVRVPRPRPMMAELDPSAFRMVALILLLAGLVVAGGDAGDRLRAGFAPYRPASTARQEPTVALWITPPEYTGLPELRITEGRSDKPVEIAEGSRIRLRIAGGWGKPRLEMGEENLALTQAEDKVWALETGIAEGDRLVVRQTLFRRIDIPYRLLPNKPPTIQITGKPEVLAKGQWRFPVTVMDDYKVASLTIRVDPPDDTAMPPLGQPIRVRRPISTEPGKAVDITPTYDFAHHAWAGQPVDIVFEAVDERGQKAATPPMRLTMPERQFRQPTAANVAFLRKSLAEDPIGSASNIGLALEMVQAKIGEYQGDPGVFLTLRSAASALFLDPGIETASRVFGQLWSVALRLEDGNMSLAMNSLQQAREKLEKLLADKNASPAEIQAAMQELRAATAQYLVETIRQIQKNAATAGLAEQITPDMLQQALQPETLDAFLDKLQAEALSGNREGAQAMLDKLQQTMESLDPSGGNEMPKDLQAMGEALTALKALVENQQTLLATTRKNAAAGNRDFKSEAARQQALLDELQRITGILQQGGAKVPEDFPLAAKAMRESANQLGENLPDISIPLQEIALEHLQKGQDSMRDQVQEKLRNMALIALGGGNVDPLGRPTGENGAGSPLDRSNIKIPDAAERTRLQEILETLRKKSGDLNLPSYELDYYRRLMRQF